MRFDPGLRGELSTGLSTAPVDNLESGLVPEKGLRLQRVRRRSRHEAFCVARPDGSRPRGPRTRARSAVL